MVKIALPRRRQRPDIAGLAAGERALAWADVGTESLRTGEPSPSGQHWAGTAAALYVPGPPEFPGQSRVPGPPEAAVRVPWTHIERADWDEASQQLRVREIAPFGDVGTTHTARLLGAERLLQLVRERVTAAVVRTQEVPYSGGGSFRVLARRSDDGAAGFVWSIELPAGADPADPRVAGEAAGALSAVQTDLGIEG